MLQIFFIVYERHSSIVLTITKQVCTPVGCVPTVSGAATRCQYWARGLCPGGGLSVCGGFCLKGDPLPL